MPAKTLWLLHIPEIVSQLESFNAPVVDRAIIERLFFRAENPAQNRKLLKTQRSGDVPFFSPFPVGLCPAAYTNNHCEQRVFFPAAPPRYAGKAPFLPVPQ
jgi:hypothetical protein